MIEVVGKKGYRETTVADVTGAAGVSRKSFYEAFANKDDCLIVAFDLIAEETVRRMDVAYRSASGWPGRVEAAISALFEAAADNPGALRLGLLEMSAAGPAGVARRERSMQRYADFIRDALELAPGDGDVSEPVLSTVVGAFNRILYRRVLLGRERELPQLVSVLVSWMTAYYPTPPALLKRQRQTPHSGTAILEGGRAPGTLAPHAVLSQRRGLPRGYHDMSRSFVAHNQRERILDAVANLTAENGYAELKIEQIAENAAVSLNAFYQHFANKEDAFLVAYEVGHSKCLGVVERAYANQPDWRLGVRAGITTLMQFLASEPAFAHMALVDALLASPRTAERSDAGITALAGMLVPAPEEIPGSGEPHEIAVEAIAAGLFELCLQQTLQGRTSDLPKLAPTATYLALAPFIDADEAAAIATGSNPAGSTR